MRALRVLAVVLNVGWVLVGVVLGVGAAVSSLGPGFAMIMAFLVATGAASAFVIVRDGWRAPGAAGGAPTRIRAAAVALNGVWLIPTLFGWASAVTGGAGPASPESALLAAALTLTLILNIALVIRRSGVPLGSSGAVG